MSYLKDFKRMALGRELPSLTEVYEKRHADNVKYAVGDTIEYETLGGQKRVATVELKDDSLKARPAWMGYDPENPTKNLRGYDDRVLRVVKPATPEPEPKFAVHLKKSKGFPVGTVRKWKTGKQVKTQDGWEPYKGESRQADMGKAIPGEKLLGHGKPMKGKVMNPENRAALDKLLWGWQDESHIAEAEDAEIAKIISQQMGGKLKAMLGATLMAVPGGLKIKWPNKKRTLGNVCVVTLRDDDTYDMEFFNGDKSVKKFEGLYAEDLKPTFEQHTGWYLSL